LSVDLATFQSIFKLLWQHYSAMVATYMQPACTAEPQDGDQELGNFMALPPTVVAAVAVKG
jgi:hypothetical protein